MMNEWVRDQLSLENSETHRRVLDFVKRRIVAARRFWSSRFPAWQEAENLYRAYRVEDDSDIRTAAVPMTEGVRKIVVPESYAQVQSILAWLLSVFAERKPMIPVEGVGPEDVVAAILHEYLLEFQFDNMEPAGPLVTYQWFLDGLVYGIGIIKNAYVTREFPALVRVGAEILERDVVSYEGNEAMNVSPYDWLPDPRLPYGLFQRGEFVSHEMRRSFTELRQSQAQGDYTGLEWIKKGGQNADKGTGIGGLRGNSNLSRSMEMPDYPIEAFDKDDDPFVMLDEMYAYCFPPRLRLTAPGETGPETRMDTPRLWVFSMANDARVIRAEPANLPSYRFPYEIIEMNYNVHSPSNPGLIEIIKDLNYHESWLFNSRMANVRKSLNNETIVDPSLIEEADLAESNASGIIRLNRHAQGGGFDMRQIAMPFPIVDVTSTHHNDARVTKDIVEQITGANRIIQGLANTGRRAATEVQGQLSLASGRMRVFALLCAIQGLGKWARQMVLNTQTFIQDAMSVRLKPPYNRVLGKDAVVIIPQLLQGRFRYPFLEAGMPNDRFFEANIWREIWTIGVNSGLAAPAMQQINFLEVFARLLMVMNVKNVGDFFQPGRFPTATAQAIAAAQQAGATGVAPDEQVLQGAQGGTLVPADGFPLPSAAQTPGVGANGLGGQNGRAPNFT